MKSSNDFTVIIPSHRPNLACEAKRSVEPVEAKLFLNQSYPSFSKLINDSILTTPTEIVIICNDKARPTADQELLTVELIYKGFGFVGLHNFRHFGFHKDLIRRIGWFDERFVGGEYEDFDFLRRVKEADIAVYMSKEVKSIERACSWNNEKSYAWNHTKWKEYGTHSVRLLPEETYPYDIGEPEGIEFKPYRDSVWVDQKPPKEFL